jgi:hypothetical protein
MTLLPPYMGYFLIFETDEYHQKQCPIPCLNGLMQAEIVSVVEF